MDHKRTNNFQAGDWLERCIGRYVRLPQRASVISVTRHGSAYLRIDGRNGTHEVESLQNWKLMMLSGTPLPGWVKKDSLFTARDPEVRTISQIISVRRGWVSCLDHLEGYEEVFRIIEGDTFLTHWEPCTAPTAWDRIQGGEF